jgi:uncharacterized protein
MSRPQGAHSGSMAGHRVDATVCARAGTSIERTYTLPELQRLHEAGAREGTRLKVTCAFQEFEGRVAVGGELAGTIVLICQRCMNALEQTLQEQFKVILVQDEAELELEPVGYEAVLADPARLDLQMLAEDQALLALPLVPRHESERCAEGKISEQPATADETRQRPFGNLRNLMRDRSGATDGE